MSVRNCGEIGLNLQKIVRRLMANDTLVNLLYYEGADALTREPLTDKQKEELVFEKIIKTIPRVLSQERSNSVVMVTVDSARKTSNKEFRNINIVVDVIVPLTQWFIDDINLRPFAILGQIQSSLEGKTINGLGKIEGGDFDLNFVNDEVICYQQKFYITEYA